MSHLAPKIQSFVAGGNLSALQYTFVKFGSDSKTVVACGANERAIGIVQNAPAAGQIAEVAVIGGGAYLKVNEVIALGKMLTSTSGGLGEVADAAGEWVGALAYQDGVQNDVINVVVIGCQAYASDA
jgi:hypothetical protein